MGCFQFVYAGNRNQPLSYMAMKIKYLLTLTILSVLSTSCYQASREQERFPSGEMVKAAMDSLLKRSDIPCVVAVAINSHGEELTYTYGPAIWQSDIPVTKNNIFRIASMTKLITSIAALQLVENGSVSLDEDLSLILPEMSAIPILTDDKKLVQGSEPVTLRHLLTHTSGFGYYFTDSLLAKHNRAEWNYQDLPRRFESGSKFLYGTSTDWAGKLVEKISGLTLEEYFRAHITGPLGMDRTWFNVPEALQNNIVSHGRRGDDGTKELYELPGRIPETNVQSYKGGGGMFSSPGDYSTLLACLLNDGLLRDVRILKKETVDEMFKHQIEGINMDISDNYFLPGFCCDFRGLIKPTSNWGLAGLIDTETTSYGRKKGTLLWGGVMNTYWFVDRESGIAASIYTQHLPFNHPATTSLFEEFSRIVYGK
jgi:methyl acetate hydrolase